MVSEVEDRRLFVGCATMRPVTSPRKFSRRDVVLGSAAIVGTGVIGACDARSTARPPTSPPSSGAGTTAETQTAETPTAETPTGAQSTSEASTSVPTVVESTSTTATYSGPAEFIDRGSATANRVA